MKNIIKKIICVCLTLYIAVVNAVVAWGWDENNFKVDGEIKWDKSRTQPSIVELSLKGDGRTVSCMVNAGLNPDLLDDKESDAYQNAMAVFGYFVMNGVRKYMAAGIVGNFLTSSGCDPAKGSWSGGEIIDDDGRTYVTYATGGLAQWMDYNENHQALSKLHGYVSGNGGKLGTDEKTLEWQCRYLKEHLGKLNQGLPYLDSGVLKSSLDGAVSRNYSNYKYGYLLYEYENAGGYEFQDGRQISEMLSESVPDSPEACALWFFSGYIRENLDKSSLMQRMEYARLVYEEFKDMRFEDGGLMTGDGDVKLDLFDKYRWLLDLGEFVDPYAVFGNETVELADMAGFLNKYKERKLIELKKWQKTIELERDAKIQTTVRSVFIFVGIFVTVYSLLLYMSYHFDKMNNFVDIDLLKVMSLGKLRVLPVEEETTYAKKGDGIKTVSQKQILVVCLLGTGVGILIISGELLKLMLLLVSAVKILFSKV